MIDMTSFEPHYKKTCLRRFPTRLDPNRPALQPKASWSLENLGIATISNYILSKCRTPEREVGGSKPTAAGERGGSVVECRTPEREVRGSRPTAAVLGP